MSKNLMSFHAKKMLSIDIGSYSTKLVVGIQNNNGLTLEQAVTIPTPVDTFSDGQILGYSNLKEAIGTALKSMNGRAKSTVCTLECSSIITREIVVPWAKPQQMKEILKFEVQQYLPIELERYIIQYKELETFTEQGVKKVNLLVAALPKEISDQYFELLIDLGLKPLALDIHSNAVGKLFSSNLKINEDEAMKEKTVAIIDLGHRQSNVIIVENGKYRFNRLLKIGGKDIDINVAEVAEKSIEEAEQEKRAIENFAQELDTYSPSTRVNNVVKTSVDRWIEEIQRIFKYYTSRTSGNEINSIYLYGGSANLGGIPRYIEEMFNIPTDVIKNIENIKKGKDVENTDITPYINAIGVMLKR